MFSIRVQTVVQGWVVSREGADEPLSTHRTQADAEAAGRAAARIEGAVYELHDHEGRLRVRTYPQL